MITQATWSLILGMAAYHPEWVSQLGIPSESIALVTVSTFLTQAAVEKWISMGALPHKDAVKSLIQDNRGPRAIQAYAKFYFQVPKIPLNRLLPFSDSTTASSRLGGVPPPRTPCPPLVHLICLLFVFCSVVSY